MRTTERASRRTFGLLDAMILVLAAALSLAWLRERSSMPIYLTLGGPGPSPFFNGLATARIWFNGAILVLTPMTFAALAFRFRGPRPSFRRVTCQPGAVGCLAAMLVFSLYFAKQATDQAAYQIFEKQPGLTSIIDSWKLNYDDLGGTAAFAGVAVLGSWLTLALGRRWRAEPSWVDRLGRALGLGWIATVPAQVAFEALWPLGIAGKI